MKRGLAILFFCAVGFGQPAKWPSVLEADVKSESWAAAERVGAALAEEIDAGRMFTSFNDVREEAKVRDLFADALERLGKTDRAHAQRCLAQQILDPRPDAPCAAQAARQRDRRISHLKAEVLASEVKIPASFPFAGRDRITVIAFSAAWCAPCEKELAELRRFENPAAKIVMLDVDQLTSQEKASFVPVQSLLGPEVPRLYVLDRQGRIRFQVIGFDGDEFFARKLDWMVEAAATQ